MGTHRGTRVRLAAAVLVSLALVVTTPALATPARAQTGPTDDVGDGQFTAGSGRAMASLATPTIAAGNLAVTVLLGRSQSLYRDRSGFGVSTLVDVPALRVSGAVKVCGQPGLGIAELLPPAVEADTAANGDTKPVAAETDSPPLVTQSASAAPEASGRAVTEMLELALPLLLSIEGADATAETTADAATQTRRALARTRLGEISLLGGMLTLEGLEWEIDQRVIGPDSRDREEEVDAGFSFGGITVRIPGMPPQSFEVGVDDTMQDAAAQANEILGRLGIQLRLPKVEHNEDAGSHEVTPLAIVVGGKDWILSPVLSQLLNNPAVRELSQQLTSFLFDPAGCQQLGGLMQGLPKELNVAWNTLGSSAPLLLAVLTGALGGTGEIRVDLGGVSTAVDDTYYPGLDFEPSALGGPTPAVPTPVGGAGEVVAPSPTTSGGTTAVAPPAPDADPPEDEPDTQEIAYTSSTACSTTSEAGSPGCWRGQAVAGGVAAALLAVALLATDEVLRRRRSPKLPTGGASA